MLIMMADLRYRGSMLVLGIVVFLFAGSEAQLGENFCKIELSPRINLCQDSTAFVESNEVVHIDTSGAPAFDAVECNCSVRVYGNDFVKINYDLETMLTTDSGECSTEIRLGYQTYGCDDKVNSSVNIGGYSWLSYQKRDEQIPRWESCVSLSPTYSNMTVRCYPSTVYIKPDDTTTPQNGNPCSSNPCKNGGSCTDLGAGQFTCACADGYEGPTCENDIDDCASSPCKNNAGCTDKVNGFECNCAAGYEGPTCETDTNECASSPCKNSASCTDKVNGFECNCAAGYEGPTCETDTNECASSPCKNSASCTDKVNGFECNCAAGYEGPTCETDTDDCASNPCKNNGACTDAVNGFTCKCTSGLTGTTCETDIDECQDSPCKNGAECTNLVNGFSCECPPGFASGDCAEAIDECTSNPCQNLGTCTDGVNSYTCACADGFIGTFCETDIDECEGTPCFNDGVCTDGKNDFTCACELGFEGKTCDINKNDCLPDSCAEGSVCEDGVNTFTCVDGPSAAELTVAKAGTDLGLVLGIVFGLLALLLIILLIICLVIRRRRNNEPKKVEQSVTFDPTRGDVTVTENELYNYDGENPSVAVNAIFVGGIPDTPGAHTDYIPHFSTDTGDRYAVIVDSTRSKPKVKERPPLSSFSKADDFKNDDKQTLVKSSSDNPYDTPYGKNASRDKTDIVNAPSENGDIGMGVHNPGYEPEYLAPRDSRNRNLASDKSDTYDYIDQAKLRMDDEVFENEKGANGDYFKIKDSAMDKEKNTSEGEIKYDNPGSHYDRPRPSQGSVTSSPDGGYMNASNDADHVGYMNSPTPRAEGPSWTGGSTSPSHDIAFTFE